MLELIITKPVEVMALQPADLSLVVSFFLIGFIAGYLVWAILGALVAAASVNFIFLKNQRRKRKIVWISCLIGCVVGVVLKIILLSG